VAAGGGAGECAAGGTARKGLLFFLSVSTEAAVEDTANDVDTAILYNRAMMYLGQVREKAATMLTPVPSRDALRGSPAPESLCREKGARTAPHLPRRGLTGRQPGDETFLERMMLVFMDLVSGYLVFEEVAEDRTYQIWY
jgi:hypothetical protein